MTTPLDPHSVDPLLRQSDPAPGPADLVRGAGSTELSAALAREVVRAERQARGRRLGLLRRHKWATATAAALIVVPTSAYAGSAFLAHTGTFGDAAMTEEDGTEWIDTCAADFPAYVRTLAPTEGALPPGQTWDTVATRLIAGKAEAQAQDCGPDGHGVREQVTGLRARYHLVAQGLWGCESIRRADASDPAGAGAAATEAATYFERLDALGVYDGDSWKLFRDRMAAQDMTFVREWFAETDCS